MNLISDPINSSEDIPVNMLIKMEEVLHCGSVQLIIHDFNQQFNTVDVICTIMI